LPDIMKWMKQVFAQRYNAASGRIGHIWGDRYWSRILAGEPALAEAAEALGRLPANGVRPRWGREEAGPCFFLTYPFPPAPAPGSQRLIRPKSRINTPSRLKPKTTRGKDPP
jgi:hypothetical protein